MKNYELKGVVPSVDFKEMNIKCGDCGTDVFWPIITYYGGEFRFRCTECKTVIANVECGVIEESALEEMKSNDC